MARLAGVSANITRLSIQPVYAKYPDAGYLLLPASALGNGPDGPLEHDDDDGMASAPDPAGPGKDDPGRSLGKILVITARPGTLVPYDPPAEDKLSLAVKDLGKF
jgi:hypothetical protein